MLNKYLAYVNPKKPSKKYGYMNTLVCLLVCVCSEDNTRKGMFLFRKLFSKDKRKNLSALKRYEDKIYSMYLNKIKTDTKEGTEVKSDLDRAFCKYILGVKESSGIPDQISVGYVTPTHEYNFNIIH